MDWKRLFALLCTSLMLHGCGGGGGSSNENNTSAVSITGTNTEILKMQAFPEGTPTGESAEVNFKLAGNLNALAGKTIYFSLEVPTKGITGEITFYGIDDYEKTARIGFIGFKTSGLPVGVYKDNLTIKACLDQACTKQLGGSPYKLPFQFTVMEGITVSQEVVNISSTYGVKSQPVTMTFTLPPGGMNWSAGGCAATPSTGGDVIVAKYPLSSDALRTFEIEGQIVPPGSYTAKCRITAWIHNAAQYLTKEFTVNYTVLDTGIGAAFSPTEINETILYCFNNITYTAKVESIVGDGPIRLAGIEYLSEPETQATSTTYYRNWISNKIGEEYSAGQSISIITQQREKNGFCFPKGAYKARLKFQSGNGDSLRESFLPVTLDFYN